MRRRLEIGRTYGKNGEWTYARAEEFTAEDPFTGDVPQWRFVGSVPDVEAQWVIDWLYGTVAAWQEPDEGTEI